MTQKIEIRIKGGINVIQIQIEDKVIPILPSMCSYNSRTEVTTIVIDSLPYNPYLPCSDLQFSEDSDASIDMHNHHSEIIDDHLTY